MARSINSKALVVYQPKASAPPRGVENMKGGNVMAPVAYGNRRIATRPRIRSLPNGDCEISHTEYINELSGSVAFTANQLQINPGLAGVFPWLCAIAQRFESYRFEELEFFFETESASSAKGSVVAAIDFDASDAVPENKTQIMAYRDRCRAQPWVSFSMRAQKEDLQKRSSYYVRAGSLSSNQDIKLYDVGNFFICTQGQADSSNVGEIHVKYRVRLMTPNLNPPGAGDAVFGTFTGSSNAAPAATVASGNLPVSVSSSGTTTSTTTFTFTQPWQGYLTLELVGTGLTTVATTGTTATVAEAANGELVNAAATRSMDYFTVNANIGQTLVLVLTNTTISAANWIFAQADV